MYTEVEVEQETYMRIELMEENMVTPEDALNTASFSIAFGCMTQQANRHEQAIHGVLLAAYQFLYMQLARKHQKVVCADRFLLTCTLLKIYHLHDAQ